MGSCGKCNFSLFRLFPLDLHAIETCIGYAFCMKKKTSRLLLLATALLAAPAIAWSPLGHRLVGDLAQRQLTPTAQGEVKRLLATEKEPSLAGVANWADELRNTDPARFKATSKWHYVSHAPQQCVFNAETDCKDGNCVVTQIERQMEILKDRGNTLEARRDALKFVVHLVGDAHQPMHSSDHPDAGGNGYQVSLKTRVEPEAYARDKYKNGVMGTNLHSMWDYYVLGETGLRARDYADKLWTTSQGRPRATRVGTPAQWAQESCELVDAWGVYPESHTEDSARYAKTMRPLAERRVEQGGYRLAVLLNSALDPAYRAPVDAPLK